MSRDYNRVILMGRLAKDPDMRRTPSGTLVARVSFATGREWKDKTTGEKKSETDFHPVQAWGPQADVLEKYCKKGKALIIEGRLHSYSYDDKNGVRKWVTEVIAESIIMLSDGRNSGQAAGASAPSAQPQAQYYPGGTDATSLRSEMGFEDEFPLDFSELSGGGVSDVDIPF